MAVNQKGANGLIAEYQCALALAEALATLDIEVEQSQDDLRSSLGEAVARVANELTPAQVARAKNQGIALGNYLFDSLISNPSAIGADIDTSLQRLTSVSIELTGHSTNSGDPSDIVLTANGETYQVVIPVSLKAYKSGTVSLGSKSARASLTRLFLGENRVSDAEFIDFFAEAGSSFLALYEDFKAASSEFYASAEGEEFVDRYEARKGSRKVNNPLRRKEVGDYFESTRGFKSEHRFADLYIDMHEVGLSKVDVTHEHAEQFVRELRFILGSPEILALNAIAGDDGKVVDVHNSLSHPAYQRLNSVLRPGVQLDLKKRERSSIVTVELRRGNVFSTDLSLAIWKDATIQYKLEA